MNSDNINYAEITISAVSPSQYPEDGLPEIVIAGRSNVGKSSFINTMVNRKNLARTSGKPGKTRTLNFFDIEKELFFVDVPGYGYAKASNAEQEKWGHMMEDYFATREELVLGILLIDFRHQPSEHDMLMYDFYKHYNVPVFIVATKSDKIKKSKHNKYESIIRTTLNIDPADKFFTFSSFTKEGRQEVWDAILAHLPKDDSA
ncbi:ribosome biogenesis GTP-binding protein YihA/YsxC [Alkalibacterium sp. 20]|uniref:ribosome biogenesis GTP-binding protein YihA/YsxC n=1 Tax=Alkalibacterium sp. 20 TaxID=1798803 RepID=UPI000900151C|nr:ribosome biogenesis GTP-binding protein YihA/YsxC [Alkalibacterium sp. 20]OJF95190.1 GTP-binding protein [Alkalibacterium sp. 20]